MSTNATAAPIGESATPVVTCRGISCCYRVHDDEIVALAEADLTVQKGEIVGIHGPSGSGKSTLLRMLAALEPPSSGQVTYREQPCWGARGDARRRTVPRPGYVMPVFQNPIGSLDARWPVWRSVTEPLTAGHRRARDWAGRSRAERRDIARRQLARVGLEELDLDARPEALSVGQCQRVAIARALIAEPELLLADEPTSALDVTSAAGIIRLLRSAAADGVALVVVSHDRRMLGALCDRLFEMQAGCLRPSAATTLG